MFARAATRAEKHELEERTRRRAAGLADISDDDEEEPSSRGPSSGQGIDDGFEGELEDYFEQFPQREAGTPGRGSLVLGAEMLRQPLNMPKNMREGKVRYEQGAMEFAKEVQDGARQWGKLNVLGNPVYAKKDPVTDLIGFDALPEDK